MQFYTPQFLVAEEYGTNEISRVHWGKQSGKDEPYFACGVWGANRIGGATIDAVHYDTTLGLTIELKGGYRCFVGPTHCKATWKLATE